MTPAEKHWRVCATSSSLRAAPDHASEQTSRLLLGERFRPREWADQGRWALGCGPDGYEGWIRAWHLVGSDSAPQGSLKRVTARWSRALAHPSPEGELLADLSFGTPVLVIGEAEAGYLPWTLPGGRAAWTPESDLAPPCMNCPGWGFCDLKRHVSSSLL